MARSQIFEGTPGQIVKQLNQLPKSQKYKVTITADEAETSENVAAPQTGVDAPKNLAQLLGDYIGAVEHQGNHHSDEVGEVFVTALKRKHEDGAH